MEVARNVDGVPESHLGGLRYPTAIHVEGSGSLTSNDEAAFAVSAVPLRFSGQASDLRLFSSSVRVVGGETGATFQTSLLRLHQYVCRRCDWDGIGPGCPTEALARPTADGEVEAGFASCAAGEWAGWRIHVVELAGQPGTDRWAMTIADLRFTADLLGRGRAGWRTRGEMIQLDAGASIDWGNTTADVWFRGRIGLEAMYTTEDGHVRFELRGQLTPLLSGLGALDWFAESEGRVSLLLPGRPSGVWMMYAGVRASAISSPRLSLTASLTPMAIPEDYIGIVLGLGIGATLPVESGYAEPSPRSTAAGRPWD